MTSSSVPDEEYILKWNDHKNNFFLLMAEELFQQVRPLLSFCRSFDDLGSERPEFESHSEMNHSLLLSFTIYF